MKVFISADIEGVTTTANWAETNITDGTYAPHARQMTSEVAAACEGAIAAGAREIVVRDAHATATNIDPDALPPCATLIRGWSGHPYSMVDGIDGTFDAAMFVGYHSAAGSGGSPLSHTMSDSPALITINGVQTSEFLLYSWAAAYEGVPTVFLSGDKRLCEQAHELHPLLKTVAVKEGFGGAVRCISPQRALEQIREESEKAIKQPLAQAKIQLPGKFELTIRYKEHVRSSEKEYYPGMKRIDETTLTLETDDYFEILRAFRFVL